MAFTFKLELADGTPAEPASIESAVPNWAPGDHVFINPTLRYRVVDVHDDDTSVLVVERD